MNVITRFAPSPTGSLHIGGARTAFFNWLFTKANSGKFYLRIEDTDQARSNSDMTAEIIQSLMWLGIDIDGDIVYQSQNLKRHQEVAMQLVKNGAAYKCYTPEAEIIQFKKDNPYKKFRSPYRNNHNIEISDKHVVRMKIDDSRTYIINDIVQGSVEVAGTELDDMIILKADGTPTYMLASCVDDYDMHITHVIRGDDHLTNTFRQIVIYEGMLWNKPLFAHIPLLHGEDGTKLSKRHGAVSVASFADDGYLPESILSYLLTLGWTSKGSNDSSDDAIDIKHAIKSFTLEDIRRSPSRFDIAKLKSINHYYIMQKAPKNLWELIAEKISAIVYERNLELEIVKSKILKGMKGLAERSNTTEELIKNAKIYVEKANPIDSMSKDIIQKYGELVTLLIEVIEQIEIWELDNIKNAFKIFANQNKLKLPVVMKLLRASILGAFEAPGIFEVMSILGKSEVLLRIR